MILLLTEKPPWVLFGWTKSAQSRSEVLQECNKIWPSGSEVFSFSSISFTYCSSFLSPSLPPSLIYSPLYSRPCFFWSPCFLGASSPPGLLTWSSSPGLLHLAFFTWPSSLLLLLLHLLLMFFLLLIALLLLLILPLDITVG